jgi:hypothetical protein
LAAQLDATGKHEITLCTRRLMDELIVKTSEGTVTVEARNLTDPTEAAAVDWVVVATKTYDAEATVPWLHKLAPEGVPVPVAQNGVEHRERFAQWVQQELLVPIVVQISVDRPADETMWQRGSVRLIVEDGRRGRELVELFRGSQSAVCSNRGLQDGDVAQAVRELHGTLSVLTMKPFAVYRDGQPRLHTRSAGTGKYLVADGRNDFRIYGRNVLPREPATQYRELISSAGQPLSSQLASYQDIRRGACQLGGTETMGEPQTSKDGPVEKLHPSEKSHP